MCSEIKFRENRCSYVLIEIFFLDEDGKPIFETSIIPIYTNKFLYENEHLQPNYIKRFNFNVKGVPKTWSRTARFHIAKINYEQDDLKNSERRTIISREDLIKK